MNKKEAQLEKIYTNLDNPAALSSIEKLYKTIKAEKISRKTIKSWLSSRDEYTVHKPYKRQKLSRKVIVKGIDALWQADLVDIKQLAKENNGYKYLLTCIDVFSKFAWVVPLENKSAKTVLEAFKEITIKRKPEQLQTDLGGEFFNKEFKEYLNKINVKLYATFSDKKASVVERFNRTLKEKLWRYFTLKETNNYINILAKIVETYNNTTHSTIKIKPKDVTKKNELKIFKNIYGYDRNKGDDRYIKKFKFQQGDKVRIVKYKHIFSKGYQPNWTYEIFKINKVFPTIPPTYTIEDLNKEPIKGEFYESELQKIIKEDDVYKVEKIIKETGKEPNRKFLVKWKGYPDTFNSWIEEKDFI